MKNKSHLLCFFFYTIFFYFSLCRCGEVGPTQTNGTISLINVGVILDSRTWVGKVGLSCVLMAVSDFYDKHNYTTRLVIHARDSDEDVVGAASAALDLLKNVKVQAIIGPQKSAEAEFVAQLGMKTQVPVVSFSATSPSLSSIKTPYFIRTAQNDSSQVKAIAAIVQTFNWREVILIYEDTDYGNGVIPDLTNAFQEIETRIPYRSVIPLSADDNHILEELYKLMTMQTRVFVVHMSSSIAPQFFLKVKEAGMMSKGYVWIITNGLTDLLDSMNTSVIYSMQGVLGVKPYEPKSKELEDFTLKWKNKFRRENLNIDRAELSVFGLWAYDTIWALAMAAEKVGTTNASFHHQETSKNLTELATLGVSQMGPELLNAILKTKFRGLSGEFNLVNGQLQSSAFQIVNVIGKGQRRIGFWSPMYGISLNLTATNKMYSTSTSDLGAVFWPGELKVVPKGWVIPTSGKKLRIGVPIKYGFNEFVKVERDPGTNITKVKGFCIDAFLSVIEALPYALPYEFVPFEDTNGKSAGYYNDLIQQVYHQKYDAVIGDITIIYSRSLYVDFTAPYTESGVSMVVPIKGKRKNAWIFIKPLSKDLWVMSTLSFTFIGFVVWLLEHRINMEFRGPRAQQVGMIFWFSFSTLVYAHREKIINNLSRFVMIVWVFIVLILQSSYTASLTSMLTVQRLEPTITNINELRRNGDYVGYQNGSFVLGFLRGLFDESKLIAYGSTEEYAEALSKGSENGGVSAIFDEIPYLKLFLATYGNHTMVGPTNKTGGFGFAFPQGSPLVSDISRAILNVTEGEKMALMEQEWLGSQTTLQDQDTKITSNSLSLDSFWPLFAIIGAVSLTAIMIFLVCFLHDHGHVLTDTNYGDTIWQRILALMRLFDQRDLSAHTFRQTVPSEEPMRGNKDLDAPPHVNASQPTLSMSNCMEENFVREEDRVLSRELSGLNPSIPPTAELDIEHSSLINPDMLPSTDETIELNNLNPDAPPPQK